MDRTNTYIKKIEKDHARFREIIRGQIRKDLRKYISNGEMVGRQGKYTVSIPLPQLRLPTFRYGANDKSGVGQGPGDVGTPIAPGDDAKAGPGAEISMGRMGKVKLDANNEGAMADPFVYDAKNIDAFKDIF